ncbi:hypothetical protein [Streptomyces otsuchiensis]|uniref:hypothetical protein n=1 Tax=Streptomyces otsuchiensis TaxID=2681388 RepID=UPI001030DA14|nr:hypothetical protein [Streptomyces otsuchiensis]
MGDRLPAPPRERKPALAALAVLLILAGALGATMLVLQAGDRVEAVMITERVPAGQPVPESAMTSVLVAEDPGVNYFTWNNRARLQEEFVPSVDLVQGTVLVGEMLSAEETLDQGEVLVGLALASGRYPSDIRPGDTVAAYWVGRDSGSGDEETVQRESVIVERAKVQNVHGGEGRGDLPVTLRVGADEAAALARAGAGGEVSLVIVPSSDN